MIRAHLRRCRSATGSRSVGGDLGGNAQERSLLPAVGRQDHHGDEAEQGEKLSPSPGAVGDIFPPPASSSRGDLRKRDTRSRLRARRSFEYDSRNRLSLTSGLPVEDGPVIVKARVVRNPVSRRRLG